MELKKTEKHTLDIPVFPGFRFIGVQIPKEGQYHLNYLTDEKLTRALFNYTLGYSFVYEKEQEKSTLVWYKIQDFPHKRAGVYLLSKRAIADKFDLTSVIRIFDDLFVLDVCQERVPRDPLGNFEVFAILE